MTRTRSWKSILIAIPGQGGAFGEIALVNKDTFRNATVVCDEDTDLMVIDQDLFDRSLKVGYEKFDVRQ